MKVLVTGATGYVGRSLVPRLLAERHEIVALVRDASRARDLSSLGVLLVQGDLRCADEIMPRDVEAVVHLAYSLFPVSDPRTNIEGSLRVIEAARIRNVRRFIYTSSALVYGPSDPAIPVTEDHPCRPNLRFARQQLRVEQVAASLAASAGFPAVILRPSELYGERGGFLPLIVERLRRGAFPLAGDGRQGISFTAVQDLVEVVTRCLTAQLAPGQVLNVNAPNLVEAAALYDRLASMVGGPRPRRIPESLVYGFGAVAGATARVLGRVPSFNLDLARLSCLRAGPRSIEKARALIGFRPTDEDPRAAIEALFSSAEDASAPRQLRSS